MTLAQAENKMAFLDTAQTKIAKIPMPYLYGMGILGMLKLFWLESGGGTARASSEMVQTRNRDTEKHNRQGRRSQPCKDCLNRYGVTVRVARSVAVLIAEIVTLVEVVTDFVVTVKVAVVFPEVTVTLAGTVAAAVLLLERVTIVPVDGAGPEIVTVPVEGDNPLTVVGFKVRELATGA
jgi:hypothetical protein